MLKNSVDIGILEKYAVYFKHIFKTLIYVTNCLSLKLEA